jgi:hypothetical protein
MTVAIIDEVERAGAAAGMSGFETGTRTPFVYETTKSISMRWIEVTPMGLIQYLRTLFVVVFALSLSGCGRQSASADRAAQPDPIAVRIATPKHASSRIRTARHLF